MPTTECCLHCHYGKAAEIGLATDGSAHGQVRFAGIIHPGLIGTAPSQELLDMWNKREKALVDEGEKAISLGTVLHTRPLGTSLLYTKAVSVMC